MESWARQLISRSVYGSCHRVQVAGLPGQVEQIVLALHQIVHAVLVAHIGDVDPHPVLDAGDVEQVAAVFRDQAVHQGDLRPQLDQPAGQVRADEAEAARNNYMFPIEKIRNTHVFGFTCILRSKTRPCQTVMTGALRLSNSAISCKFSSK